MVMVHPSCDDRDSHEDSSSRIRVADATLRRSSSSDISDSTDGSASKTDKDTPQRRPRRRIRGDFEFRLSATITRTHPSPEPIEESLPSPDGATSSSRSSSPSGDSNGGGTSIRRRKKCQPRHRCTKTNESITSILRPSKYSSFSSSDDITIDNIHLVSSGEADDNNATLTIETMATTTKKSSLFRRSSSSKPKEGLPSASMHSYFLPSLETSTPPPPSSLNKSQKRPSCNSLDGQWIPSGVDFSSSVEVHVFYK